MKDKTIWIIIGVVGIAGLIYLTSISSEKRPEISINFKDSYDNLIRVD